MTAAAKIRLETLDWNRPAVESAVERLIQRHADDTSGELDLSNLIVVFPGDRGRQCFLGRLVRESERGGLALHPPKLTTVGSLPEFLYHAKRPFASDIAERLAWIRALQEFSTAQLQPLMRNVPKDKRMQPWMPMAVLLQGLHRRLAAEVLDFQEVQRVGHEMDSFPESRRWTLLSQLQRKYYDQLDAVGLWDKQAARTFAIRNRECQTDRQILLVGAVDLNRMVREMLAQVPQQTTVFVVGDASETDAFDEFGCLRSSYWSEREIGLRDEQIQFADRPGDQAIAVVDRLHGLAGDYRADQITLGVPDPSIARHVERILAASDIPGRDMHGRPLHGMAATRLLLELAKYVKQQSYEAYAAILRHPDLERWISAQLDETTWLHSLDLFQNEFLPSRIFLNSKKQFRRFEVLEKVHALVHKLLEPIAEKKRPLAEWAPRWQGVLSQIYGDQIVDPSIETGQCVVKTVVALHDAFSALLDIPGDWSFPVSAEFAIQTALDPILDRRMIAAPDPNAIEMIGWLDLPLDDAPVAIVTGMNDEFVPSSESSHLFLPNSLCSELGIADNTTRYARDAYILSLLVHSRKKLFLVAGRRDVDNDPLAPSRLLFATDAESLTRRAKAFFDFRGRSTARIWLTETPPTLEGQRIPVPPPVLDHVEIESLRVTDFRDYLRCPYRFYLSKVLNLWTFNDELREFPPFVFGNVIHEVVENFAQSDAKDSAKLSEIRDYLEGELDRITTWRLGRATLPAVRIQIEQMRTRLGGFALAQMEWRQQGWQIVSAEQRGLKHALMVDGQPFTVAGQIDRVDRHEETGAIAVLDYKTADRGGSPEFVHQRQGEWVDIQLPMYRHLARELDFEIREPVELGFITVPRDSQSVKFQMATWEAADLNAADQIAFDIIRAIRRKEFWPPADPPVLYAQHFEAICQDKAFERFDPGEVPA